MKLDAIGAPVVLIQQAADEIVDAQGEKGIIELLL